MIPEFRTADERTKWITANADMFTAIRFHGFGKYERHEYKSLEEAEKAARRMADESNGYYMIYACYKIYDTFVKSVHRKEK